MQLYANDISKSFVPRKNLSPQNPKCFHNLKYEEIYLSIFAINFDSNPFMDYIRIVHNDAFFTRYITTIYISIYSNSKVFLFLCFMLYLD